MSDLKILKIGSFPAGNGGRVEVPIFDNGEGKDASVDPVSGSIYSGMLKRTARMTGRFTPDFEVEE